MLLKMRLQKLCESKNYACKYGISQIRQYTESSKYYARQQTAVARGLAWPARCLTGHQTAASSKHSLCFLVQFPSNWSRALMYICKMETLAFSDCDYC